MTDLFLKMLNLSITVSWVVLAVLILRQCLKKAPKWITCLLWGVVGLRLLLPFSFQSGLSLIPSTQTIPQDIAFSKNPGIYTGISSVDQAVNPVITEQFAPQGLTSINPLQLPLQICAVVWLVGVAAMLLYGVISTLGLYRTVRASVKQEGNVYLCDDVQTPFILGVLRPRIYLPSWINSVQRQSVVAHENAHLQRKDHWWKPLGFLLLSVYWFNPLLWAAYILLCRDIELACDEKVIRTMDAPSKKAYSEALVNCGSDRRFVMVCPLAFGEVGVKERIKAVLHYKKPAFWIIVVSAVAAVVLTVCFLTDPLPCEHAYRSKRLSAPTCTAEGVMLHSCENCGDNYEEPLPMLEHDYAEGEVLVAPSCTTTGTQELICAACGAKSQKEMEIIAHTTSAELVVSKEPNCTETGEKTGVCDVCKQTYLAEIMPTNDVHDMKTEVITASTCTVAGEGKNTCNRCNQTEMVTLELAAHDYEVVFKGEGSCAIPAQDLHRCKNCNLERLVTGSIDPDNHAWMTDPIAGTSICYQCGATKSNRKSNSSSGNNNTTTDTTDTTESLFPIIKWDLGNDPNQPIIIWP